MGLDIITYLEGTDLHPFENTPRRYQNFFNEFNNAARSEEAVRHKDFCDNWPCGYVTVGELLNFDYGSTAEMDGTDLISWETVLSGVDDSFFTTLNELKKFPPQTRLFYGFS